MRYNYLFWFQILCLFITASSGYYNVSSKLDTVLKDAESIESTTICAFKP
jgi:hypothetical protein